MFNTIYIIHHLTFCYDAAKRSRPSYLRDTANRFDLTLQGGSNQHDTQKPRRTPRTNLSPLRLELKEPAQRHIVSRALRETTNNKHMRPLFSAATRVALGVGCGFLYFRSKAVLGLPVSTTSYSRHAVSIIKILFENRKIRSQQYGQKIK